MTDLAPRDYDVALPLDAPVRLSDPDTSVIAAKSIQMSAAGDRALALAAIFELGGRATADEVCERLQAQDNRGRIWQRNCVSSRISQLLRSGMVRDTGDRKPGTTGRPVMIVEAVR